MKQYLLTAFLFITILVSRSMHADINGNFKNYGIYNHSACSKDDLRFFETIRLKLSEQFCQKYYGEITYELSPLFALRPITIGTAPFSAFTFDGVPYRVIDLNDKLLNFTSHAQIFQNLDRVLFSVSMPNMDLTLGRQPISFGVARAVNPTDIILPYPFYTIDAENRIGVDALRTIISLTDLSQIDMGFVSGEDLKLKNSLAFFSPSFNVQKTDIAPMLMYFKNNYLFGLNLQRPLWDAGFWIEAAYVLAGSQKPPIDNLDYFSLSTGVDYNFSERIYAYIEYHYNGAGSNNKHHYFSNLFQVAYFDGDTYLLGKHYLIPSLNYEISPLWSLYTVLYMNLSDQSASVNGVVHYNITENAYIDFNALIGVGPKKSEFYLLSDRFFLALRYYF